MFETKLINITLKVPVINVTGLENHLREHFEVISYKILPDTDELYKTNSTFKKLVKAVKEAQKLRDIYINENN